MRKVSILVVTTQEYLAIVPEVTYMSILADSLISSKHQFYGCRDLSQVIEPHTRFPCYPSVFVNG